jgi:KDO2-lipid IV(A) lauroyltransferase
VRAGAGGLLILLENRTMPKHTSAAVKETLGPMPANETVLATRSDSAALARGGGGGGRPLSRFTRAKFAVVRWFLMGWVRLFSLKGLHLLGRWFGTLEFLLNFRRRERYWRELQRIFGQELERSRGRKIIWHYFRRTRCDKLFYLIFDRLPRDKIMRRIRFQGRQYLDEALTRGHGVYVMLSHNGSHHVAGLLMALLGYRCAGIRDRQEGAIRTYVQERYAETFAEYAAVRVLYADSFPRDIYRCFHENRVVGSALDVGRVRGLTLKTCPVQIFGEQREFLTGTLQIALRCRATICQAFVVSRPNFYFRLIVHPPFHVPGDESDHGQVDLVQRIMQQYADGIAAHVREHPDHLSRA